MNMTWHLKKCGTEILGALRSAKKCGTGIKVPDFLGARSEDKESWTAQT
jgi:hypothetical protein